MTPSSKDIQIARQSNLTKSLELLNGQNIRPDIQLTIKIAELLTDYVQYGLEENTLDKAKKIDKYLATAKRKPLTKTIVKNE